MAIPIIDSKLSRSAVVFEVLKSVYLGFQEFDKDKEHFFVIGLTRSNTIKYIDLVSTGSISSTIVEPREVFRMAIHKAVGGGIIIAHNHPSGNLSPSNADIGLTKELVKAGLLLRIPVTDHLIFSEDGYYSFADEGML